MPRILPARDEALIAMLLEEGLRDARFEASRADDGLAALPWG